MNIDKLFSDKIDWNFYNYLSAILQEYKVAGYIPIISICTKSTNNSYDKIYESDNGYNKNIDLNVINYWYNKYGIFYRIKIIGAIDDGFTKELFSKIKGRAIRSVTKEKNILTVKPIILSN